MPARPISADEHQRPDRIAGRALDFGGRQSDTTRLRLLLLLDLGTGGLAGLSPIAVESPDQFAARQRRPARPLPGRPVGVFGNIAWRVLQTGKERLPLRVDGLRIGFKASVKIVDIGGVAAVKKGAGGESCVRILT